MRWTLLLILCACGHAASEPRRSGALVEAGTLVEAERRALAEVEDSRRSGPISRPRLPRVVRSLAELDRGIEATERMSSGLAPEDDEVPVLMLELAVLHAERGFVLRAAGQDAAASDERALALVRRLAGEDRFRGFRRLDEALLLLAELCERRGEVEAMKAAYVRLSGEFSGMYIPGAYLAFADLQYAAGELEEACVLYEKVLTFVDSPVHAYALYRRAWCDRVESPERAQEGFRRAIAAAEEGRGGTPAEARVVRAAARLDLERAVTR